ncbi:MAG: hypothetical protein RI947_594 [Candidatus Parcubacteria bacterium]|jgi:hypothetical protein
MTKIDFTDKLINLFESEDGELFKPKERPLTLTPDDRLTESFKKIIEFVDEYDRIPDIESLDINEAMFAKRLEAIKNNPEKTEALMQFDTLGLLVGPEVPKTVEDLFEKDEFGLFSGSGSEVLKVKNVPAYIKASPDSIARRKKAEDFNLYKQGFIDMQKGLESGKYKLVRFTNSNQIKVGRYYISMGLMVFVERIGDKKIVHGITKARTRLIFENGTESEMYDRSLAIDLYEDGYCVVSEEELFDDINIIDDIKGYIYVVRSLSEDPKISTIENLYKIGFSTTPVSKRISGTKDDPTYLMAEVELVESFKVTGEYNPQKIEHFIHRIFTDAALDISIIDKHGRNYIPKEWYCVPIHIIRLAVELIATGEIVNYIFDSNTQRMIEISRSS